MRSDIFKMTLEKIYAGIGSRSTPQSVLETFRQIASTLAQDGWTLSTGGCRGADQAFVDGVLQGGGKARVFLPWDSYEWDWRSGLLRGCSMVPNVGKHRGQIEIRNAAKLSPRRFKKGLESVERFHPWPTCLSQAARSLQARNWHICFPREEPFDTEPVSFIICWTPKGEICGGTGQALRIAKEYGIEVFNFGKPNRIVVSDLEYFKAIEKDILAYGKRYD